MRINPCVVVQSGNILASGRPNGDVIPRSKTQVLFVADDAYLWKFLGHEINRPVRGGIIDQDHLEALVGLRQNRR